MGISDIIAAFINETLAEAENGIAEIQRAELASRFNCVPSQINYVISTRFSPERGYIVESRRGGGGYIRISRVRLDPKQLIMHTVNSIGNAIDTKTAAAFLANAVDADALDGRCAVLMMTAIGDRALHSVDVRLRDVVRADILKQLLIRTLQEGDNIL